MPTYLDELTRLRTSNLLGGIAEGAEAIKDMRQNQRLSEVYADYKSKLNELKTTGEQVSDLDIVMGRKAPAGLTLEEQGAFTALDEAGKVAFNMYRAVSRMDAYTGLLSDVVAPMSTLGDDGVRLAGQLTNQINSLMAIEEKRAELPYRALQYQSAALQYKWNGKQYEEFIRQSTYNENIRSATDAILNNNKFELFPAGEQISYDDGRGLTYSRNMDKIIDETFAQFQKEGKQITRDEVQGAMKIALDRIDFKFKTIEAPKDKVGTGTGTDPQQNQFLIGGITSLLERYTQQWLNYDEGFRNAVRDYDSGKLPEKITDKSGEVNYKYGLDAVKAAHEIYYANGTYMQYYDYLSGIMQVEIDGKVVGFNSMTKENYGGYDLTTPVIKETNKILRPRTSTGIMTGDYIFNPASRDWVDRQLGTNAKKLTSGSRIPTSDQPDALGDYMDTLYEIEGVSEVTYALEKITRNTAEDLGIRTSPDTRMREYEARFEKKATDSTKAPVSVPALPKHQFNDKLNIPMEATKDSVNTSTEEVAEDVAEEVVKEAVGGTTMQPYTKGGPKAWQDELMKSGRAEIPSGSLSKFIEVPFVKEEVKEKIKETPVISEATVPEVVKPVSKVEPKPEPVAETTKAKDVHIDTAANAIAVTESSGGNYDSIGAYVKKGRGRGLGAYQFMSYRNDVRKIIKKKPGGAMFLAKLDAGMKVPDKEVTKYFTKAEQDRLFMTEFNKLIEEASKETDPSTGEYFTGDRLLERAAQKHYGGRNVAIDGKGTDIHKRVSVEQYGKDFRDNYNKIKK